MAQVVVTHETKMTQRQCDDDGMRLFMMLDSACHLDQFSWQDRAQAVELLVVRFRHEAEVVA